MRIEEGIAKHNYNLVYKYKDKITNENIITIERRSTDSYSMNLNNMLT